MLFCLRRVSTHWRLLGQVTELFFEQIFKTAQGTGVEDASDNSCLISLSFFSFPFPGYQISWEVYSRNESRLAHTLANTTLEYKITGLSSLTTYTIEVAAETSKGTGMVTSSTISSGVPPGW